LVTFRVYICDTENLLDFAIIIVVGLSVVAFTYVTIAAAKDENDSTTINNKNGNPEINVLGHAFNPERLKNLMTFGVVILNMQLFNILRMFEFFASFVRSMIEIIEDSIPLLSVLFLVVMTNTVVFTLQRDFSCPHLSLCDH